MPKLGENMQIGLFCIKGISSKVQSRVLVEKIVKTLKMNKAHDPICYGYPTNGSGGVGHTYIQPITESFIALDAWPDHNGSYLIICSCKEFNPEKVAKLIEKLGYRIKEIRMNELNLIYGGR